MKMDLFLGFTCWLGLTLLSVADAAVLTTTPVNGKL